MKKDRLTERDKYGNAYFPECFEDPCSGNGCVKETCEFMTKVCEKLAKYEETEERHGENTEKVKDLIKMLKTAKRNNDMVYFVPGHSETKNMIECLEDYLKIKENAWVPVTEKLPEEQDSIFAKYKGTPDWKPGMFKKTSKYVLATIKYKDGTVLTEPAYTVDGRWKTKTYIHSGEVIAWMPFPEPYKED